MSGSKEPTEATRLLSQSEEVQPASYSTGTRYKARQHPRHHGFLKKRTAADKIFRKDKELAEEIEKQQPKLGTYSGVFLPTALNVLSILMFLRFGFIVGQLGMVGALFTLILCYTINLLTTLSVSAIATNGIVRTGGAYYMISRSLGPEFGGAIGLIFYFGQILNAALNVVGLIEPLINNFGLESGSIWPVLPESYFWSIIYSTVILFVCVAISLVGADMVSRAALLLFIMLVTSIMSIPVSAIFVGPFAIPSLDTYYSGLSWHTFKENLMPHFTKHAAGSQIPGTETFADLFGIFFPATAGILAGASMSGSLKNPSKSIPKGTLWGLLLTFFCYAIVILSLGAAVPRDLLHKDVLVIQTVSLAEIIIILGEFSTSLFSIIMGVVGAADILSAISKDVIIPGLSVFANRHTNPVKAILFSWLLIQGFLFANINQIATLITMAFLMTFIVINVACFLLEISAAPNFRPSFDYFNRATAAAGVVSCFIAMFIVDGLSATMIIFCLLFLIIFIHYVCPPKSWGDVSQTLIYHQVRKYLFKLRLDNVKYWRPQILLLVDNPRTCWNLMHFCNHLKKGGLYILGHVIISTDDFENNYVEYARERNAWVKLRDMLNLKAFVQFSFSSAIPWGVRNIFLGSGLGNMKPNIIVIGFLDLSNRKMISASGSASVPSETPDPSMVPKSIERLNPAYNTQGNISKLPLPTDFCKSEKRIKITEWVQCIEELLLMKANVAVAKGFPRLSIPDKNAEELDKEEKNIIDLYPIQMSAEIAEKSGQTILSTNFDTYTLILQLGAILTTVPQWHKTHRLRIVVFVELPEDIDEERSRVSQLISILRINAEILIVSFDSGNYSFYDCIVKNKCADKRVLKKVNRVLQNNEWWKAISAMRSENEPATDSGLMTIDNSLTALQSKLHARKNNIALSKLQRLGVKFKMRTNKLLNAHIYEGVPVFGSSSSGSDDSDLESLYGGYDSDPEADIRRKANYTLASERRMRRKTFSSLNETPSSAPPKTPKTPKFAESRTQNPIPGLSLDDDADTLKRPVLSRQSSRHSYSSIRSQARPNFTSQALPKSKVNEEATGVEPSIIFTEDDRGSIKSRASSIKGSKRVVSRSAKEKTLDADTSAGDANNTNNVSDGGDSDLNSISENSDSDNASSSVEEFDIDNLTFNDVPARAQHLILNQLMMKTSKNSAVIFSTLPTPPPGCYKSKKDSIEYVETLDLWCKGLPPIFLINSRTMTVTTAL